MDVKTPNATSISVIVCVDDDKVESEEQPLVHRKKDRDSIASAALLVVLSGGESSSGRVVKISYFLDLCAFQSFLNILDVGRPPIYTTQMTEKIPPHNASAPHPSGAMFIRYWDYSREQSLMEPKATMSFSLEFCFTQYSFECKSRL